MVGNVQRSRLQGIAQRFESHTCLVGYASKYHLNSDAQEKSPFLGFKPGIKPQFAPTSRGRPKCVGMDEPKAYRRVSADTRRCRVPYTDRAGARL
jgi:hypothetical protein